MSVPQHIIDVYQQATCLYSKSDVENALDVMAKNIHDDLANENPIFLCVMVGGLIPAGHLLERIDFPLEIDYIHATRYQGKTVGGDIAWKYQPNIDFSERKVLIIDDILDGGITLKHIKDFCINKGSPDVRTAVLVEKKGTRLANGLAKADYTGLHVDDHYVFGYGMDYHQYLRNAPGIFAVSSQHTS